MITPGEKKNTVIFICIDWFLPAYKAGGPVQSVANMVNHLSAENIRFKIFCSNTDLGGEEIKDISLDKWVTFNNCTDVWYASGNTRKIKTLKNEIKKSDTDILFTNGLYSWFFSIVPVLFCYAPRKIISVRGMLHPGALSQKTFKKKVFLFLFKLTGINNKYEFHATSETEAGYIHQIFGPAARVNTAANFPKIFEAASPPKKENHIKLISVALISPMKNHLLVLQALKQCSCNVEYDIYGPVKDAAYWEMCKVEIKKLPENIKVNYHGGTVPVKVEAALQQDHVFILPSKSENFGHAIYEAFTAGKPVITSSNTPWKELQKNTAGINIDVLSVEAITKAIVFFAAMDQLQFNEWQNGAVTYARNNTDTAVIKSQYLKMFLSQFFTS